jgi:hypothetical protein
LLAEAWYDFGLTAEQFGEYTPSMIQDLRDRRWQRFRRECFPTAMVLAQKYNSHRPEGAELRSPMSFLPGYEPKELSERERIQQNVRARFTTLRDVDEATAERLRLHTIEKLKKAGHEDAEELIDEVFVAWSRKLKDKKQ